MTATASQWRAVRWLAEMRAGAAAAGTTLDAGTEHLFAHLIVCPYCQLRENNDPRFCAVGDAIQDEDDGP